MKRVIMLLLVLLLTLCLCACGSKGAASGSELDTQTAISDVDEEAGDSEEISGLPYTVTVTDQGAEVTADGLAITCRDGVMEITVSNISVADIYTTNLPESQKNGCEYSWNIKLCGEEETFQVSTSSWAFEPGKNEEKRIEDMDHGLWKYTDDGGYALVLTLEGNGEVPITVSHTADSITWNVDIPEQYIDMTTAEMIQMMDSGSSDYTLADFVIDFAALEKIEVSFQNSLEAYSETIVYVCE